MASGHTLMTTVAIIQVLHMKKQNVKLTLLASLLTGLLSQGARAAANNSGATIILSAEVAKTTCNVSPCPTAA